MTAQSEPRFHKAGGGRGLKNREEQLFTDVPGIRKRNDAMSSERRPISAPNSDLIGEGC